MTVVTIVGCCGPKRTEPCAALDLYISAFFKKCRALAERRGDPWLILSAKYGVVLPEQMLDPYDLRLADLSPIERTLWRERVRQQLAKQWLGARFFCLALDEYAIALRGRWCLEPMRGLRLGPRLQWLNKELAR